jgi:predicted Zn-dependent protease
LPRLQNSKKETPSAKSGKVNRYVRCVANAITAALPGIGGPRSWEVVFQDDAVNEFAQPGGKIGVYTGLLKVAQNQHQLATVLGHEVTPSSA